MRPVDLIADQLPHRAVGTRHHDRKFIAADPAENIDRTEAAAQDIRHALQHAVAHGVTVSVVDALEVIDVDQDEGHVLRIRALHQKVIGTAVKKPGQRVVRGFMSQFFVNLLILQQDRVIGSRNEAELLHARGRDDLLCLHHPKYNRHYTKSLQP